MAILPLIFAPNKLLKKVSKPVEKIDDALRQFMDEMVQTMYHQGGVGLAAVQVGHLKRVVVMDTDYEEEEQIHHDHSQCGGVHVKNTNPIYFVNPVIVESSQELSTFYEGCLSFPGAKANVTRPEEVRVKFLDYDGKEQVMNMEGLRAICIQHEIDHLNGITFVDHISNLKREVILKKMRKTQL